MGKQVQGPIFGEALTHLSCFLSPGLPSDTNSTDLGKIASGKGKAKLLKDTPKR